MKWLPENKLYFMNMFFVIVNSIFFGFGLSQIVESSGDYWQYLVPLHGVVVILCGMRMTSEAGVE